MTVSDPAPAIGLRRRPRDPALPALSPLAGAAELCAPSTDEVAGWIDARLRRTDAPAVSEVTWEYARWKPGVSTTCAFAVCFADGSRDVVVTKRYADGKERELSSRALRGLHWRETSPRLEPRAILRDERTALFVQTADRELPGTPYLLDSKKVARFLTDAGLAAPGTVRKRRLAPQLLRYKPERRAVYSLDVRLRPDDKQGPKDKQAGDVRSGAEPAPDRLELGCRVLPPAVARTVVQRRRAFEALAVSVPAPRLKAWHERGGILFEEWLHVQSAQPTDFGNGHVAGELLARLHAAPRPASAEPVCAREVDFASLEPLFALLPAATWRPSRARLSDPAAVTWCHADFHPDQLARSADGRWHLLDLDCLTIDDPLWDLASWIADAGVEGLECGGSPDLESLAVPLLSGYTALGAAAPGPGKLWERVAVELVQRAAATLRRLEVGAPLRAARVLALGREIAPRGVLAV